MTENMRQGRCCDKLKTAGDVFGNRRFCRLSQIFEGWGFRCVRVSFGWWVWLGMPQGAHRDDTIYLSSTWWGWSKVAFQDRPQFVDGFLGPDIALGDDGVFQGVVCRPVCFFGDFGDDRSEEFSGGVGVAVEVFDDLFDCDVVVVFIPGIVVGDHGHGGVGDFRFPGAFGFAEVGHADDGAFGVMVEQGFGFGAEGGTFHVDVAAAVVTGDILFLRCFQEDLPQMFADRVGEGDVGNNALAEEGVVLGLLGSINELINHHNVAGVVLGLKGAHCADADDPFDAERFHGPDVGAVVEFGGHQAVSAAVSGKEHHFASFQFAHQECVRWFAEGCVHRFPGLVGESVQIVETAASNYSDAMIRHGGIMVGGFDVTMRKRGF